MSFLPNVYTWAIQVKVNTVNMKVRMTHKFIKLFLLDTGEPHFRNYLERILCGERTLTYFMLYLTYFLQTRYENRTKGIWGYHSRHITAKKWWKLFNFSIISIIHDSEIKFIRRMYRESYERKFRLLNSRLFCMNCYKLKFINEFPLQINLKENVDNIYH